MRGSIVVSFLVFGFVSCACMHCVQIVAEVKAVSGGKTPAKVTQHASAGCQIL